MAGALVAYFAITLISGRTAERSHLGQRISVTATAYVFRQDAPLAERPLASGMVVLPRSPG